MMARGREPRFDHRGELNGRAKLSRREVDAIRSLYPGTRQEDLALAFGVNQTTISAIVRGRLWPNEEGEQ
jgi:hypothetical protein